MYATLYRKGESAEIRGIKCDVNHCLISNIPNLKAEGWISDLESLRPKKRGPKKSADKTEIEAGKDESG